MKVTTPEEVALDLTARAYELLYIFSLNGEVGNREKAESLLLEAEFTHPISETSEALFLLLNSGSLDIVFEHLKKALEI